MDQVFLVIRHKVKPGAGSAYEGWLSRIIPAAAKYPGHLGMQVVRPPSGHDEYVNVLRFATALDADRWQNSPERAVFVAEAQALLADMENIEVKSGIDYWFTPPAVTKAPPRWKQWLATTSVIWPLTIVVPWAFEPIFKAIPDLQVFGVRHGILASVIVGLVVYVIMPRYVRLLSPWFFRR
jgi:antibiotic biosynthesis monooxygenase (ABM) superfamily enzyme